MADVDISYNGSVIASMDDTGTTTLETAGMYCEDDISVTYTKSGGGGGGLTNPIRFGLNGAYAFCESGMTWADYISWEYCIGIQQGEYSPGWMLENKGTYIGNYSWKVYYYDGGTIFVQPNDVIVAERFYDLYFDD